MRFHRERSTVFLALVILAGAFASVEAQQPRTRTLKYDASRREWVELPPPPPGTAEGDLHQIRMLIADGDHRAVLSSVKRSLKLYGTSSPHYPDLLIAKAEALIGRREYHEAYTVLEQFLNEFGGTKLTPEALRLEFVIAETYLTGVKRKIWGFRWLSGEDIAYQILDDISVNYPNSRYAEFAIKTKADDLFRKGRHGLAELEYARLLRDYPQTRYHRYALRRSAEAALASFAGVEYDDAALIEAEERYRDYRARYGRVAEREDRVIEILDAIRERRAEKEFSIGAYYERTGHVSSAVFYYQSVRAQWPDSVAATKAVTRLELIGAPGPVATASPTRRSVGP